jgi:hypothetical protein
MLRGLEVLAIEGRRLNVDRARGREVDLMAVRGGRDS